MSSKFDEEDDDLDLDIDPIAQFTRKVSSRDDGGERDATKEATSEREDEDASKEATSERESAATKETPVAEVGRLRAPRRRKRRWPWRR